MNCAAVMTANPSTILASDSVADAAAKLVAEREAALPVVDAGGRYVGMFGIRDLLGLVLPRGALAGDLVPNLRFLGDDAEAVRGKFQAASAMTAGEMADRRVPTLHPEMAEIEALRAFSREQTTLAVVARDTGKLAGVVCCRDVIRALTGAAQAA
jgi:CBS-domain-containing membrane protein